MHKKVFLLLTGIFFIPMVAVVILVISLREHPKDSSNPVAVYDNFEITGNPSFYMLVTDNYSAKMGRIYIELPEQKRFLIGALPEEVVGDLINDVKLIDGETCYGSAEYTYFCYREGKLKYASLYKSSQFPFRISSHKDGPYVAFPFDQKTLIEVFGEPNSWREAHIIRPPW